MVFGATATVPSQLGTGAAEGVVTGRRGPVADAVVALLPVDGAREPEGPRSPAIVDQRRLRFVPRVVVVTLGQSVAFRNSDPLLHNIFSPGPSEAFDLGTYPEGQSRAHRFERPGPHVILCNIHPEMEAWVYVVPTPYAAVTDGEGRFRVDGVPAGRYTMRVWHRRTGLVERTVRIAEETVRRVEVRLEEARERSEP